MISLFKIITEQISPEDLKRKQTPWISPKRPQEFPKNNRELPGLPSLFDENPFTPELFAQEVKKQGLLYPDIVIAQAFIESGNFKSDIFKENNNPFGMKHPSVRQTTSIGKNRNHAKYKSWIDSIKDMKLWQKSLGMDKLSREEYLDKLTKIYCPAGKGCLHDDYGAKVNQLTGKAIELMSKKIPPPIS